MSSPQVPHTNRPSKELDALLHSSSSARSVNLSPSRSPQPPTNGMSASVTGLTSLHQAGKLSSSDPAFQLAGLLYHVGSSYIPKHWGSPYWVAMLSDGEHSEFSATEIPQHIFDPQDHIEDTTNPLLGVLKVQKSRLEIWAELVEDIEEHLNSDNSGSTMTPEVQSQASVVSYAQSTATNSQSNFNQQHQFFLAEVQARLDRMYLVENLFAFPGPMFIAELERLIQEGDITAVLKLVTHIHSDLDKGTYRVQNVHCLEPVSSYRDTDNELTSLVENPEETSTTDKPYFEVLIVDNMNTADKHEYIEGLKSIQKHDNDAQFVYSVNVVPSFQDAIVAVIANPIIQAIVIRPDFLLFSPHASQFLVGGQSDIPDGDHFGEASVFANLLILLRPELDIYLVTTEEVETVIDLDTAAFRRIFYRSGGLRDLHLSLISGVQERFDTPFFSALATYSRTPTGVFHALPISRGNSLTKSHWITYLYEFYGTNIFQAETSATCGGLDSLLQPSGPIKTAQKLAGDAFNSDFTFFVTNGTSTGNKIVLQALIRDGDYVLIDRDCHKSQHYGIVLAGARVLYLDAYPLDKFSMYGGVPIREIKRQLLALKAIGKLDKVRLLLLTNCTFDGIVYNVRQIVEECLAIKPDLIFVFDEAWFSFAGFHPVLRTRTAMHVARNLREKLKMDEYAEEYEKWAKNTKLETDEDWLNTRLYPDPAKAHVRMYATQSTHKTLSALRQGSMIHISDVYFKRDVDEVFHEAYFTHTSTSPNYQILASLDVGRSQVQLEGYELVSQQVEHAITLRTLVANHELLSEHFSFLEPSDMVPDEYRGSGFDSYSSNTVNYVDWERSWEQDEFVLDPTRLTLYVGKLGVDGDTFKREYLMDKFDIQVNKTTLNSVLVMTNIGTTRSAVVYLASVLVDIAREINTDLEEKLSHQELLIRQRRIKGLTKKLPPLPDFSAFHPKFSEALPNVGNLRKAFYLAYDQENCEFASVQDGEAEERLDAGDALVSASFVIPYPPGFPILVPGQLISLSIVKFMLKLDVSEIHGYRPEIGLRVFTQDCLDKA